MVSSLAVDTLAFSAGEGPEGGGTEEYRAVHSVGSWWGASCSCHRGNDEYAYGFIWIEMLFGVGP